MDNIVEFKVTGKYALFTDPITRVGGEKCTYQIPTYEALKGIMCSIYWKPTFIWVIDRVRILRPIRTQARNIRPIKYSGGNDLSIYTYLIDVEYQVQAHFIWNMHRPDLEKDRNENKHFFSARRMIERGGRRDVFLGTRECQAYVEPVKFGEAQGYYDNYGTLAFDLMFHGFDYPDETGKGELQARFWRPTMQDGVIQFIKPEDCSIRRVIRPMIARPPSSVGLDEPGLLEGYSERVA
ncbi:type I-C CRISPR-associated protein Cas5c [Leptolinea tardivitalis]|uniref:pre-crRNA processing endonuclease n=1 Tax=Leptolinea tardivitalis TaxID=229920 RepID=A0A0P6WY02_9CHLR|nr:type I-C CRISPR-associated protein Cas5c [Leptolinea tardivitalis]KPL71272.1 CRISPR-associated protein Cas5 [Leptolinea tardivitalis]GAP23037.1 CRISPR-associated protein, Cas5d family [Leptolinea tardivitalis]